MLADIFSAVSDWGLLILRVALGVIFIVHGWPKLNPNSPIKGIAGFAGFLQQLGVPAPRLFAWVVALLEAVGGVLLILGPLTRLISVGLAIDMLVAIILVKRGMAKAPFADPKGAGWEFEFALLAASLALVFTGPGAIALPWGAGW
ncbi:MAG: DoxX family protein [Armatimonadota bacterium]|nr:DoxX family protein [Armatimonadota bacterium]MDR5696166.1 DoxX family protein [Armatimonadota bacterium]